MTSCKRVKTALEHKEPDKIPFDLGGTEVSGINLNALPYDTHGEVREETKRRIDDSAPGDGFIFAPIHVI